MVATTYHIVHRSNVDSSYGDAASKFMRSQKKIQDNPCTHHRNGSPSRQDPLQPSVAQTTYSSDHAQVFQAIAA